MCVSVCKCDDLVHLSNTRSQVSKHSLSYQTPKSQTLTSMDKTIEEIQVGGVERKEGSKEDVSEEEWRSKKKYN